MSNLALGKDLSIIDRLFRTYVMRTRFFTEGWGSAEDMRRILALRRFAFSSRENCTKLLPDASRHPLHIDKVEESGNCKILSGHFSSPLNEILPGLLPKESETAYFEVVLPKVRPAVPPKPFRESLERAAANTDTPLFPPTSIMENGRSQAKAARVTDSSFMSRWILSSMFNGPSTAPGAEGGQPSSLAFPWRKHDAGLLSDAAAQLYNPKAQPMIIQLAGTGDHFFWRRRHLLAKPLVHESGIGSVILENPFYGLRKPSSQWRSSLHRVTDLFLMGVALIAESAVVLQWCEQNGYGPLGITGFSMGGHLACLAASAWPKPLAIVPCLSASTASAVFADGVLSRACAWPALQEQLDQIEAESLLFPAMPPSVKVAGIARSDIGLTATQRDAVTMMRQFMDEATHLCNFFVPVTTEATVIVVAKNDAYIPLPYAEELSHLWPGSEVRYVGGGHVSSFLLKQKVFKRAIMDAVARASRLEAKV